MTAIAWVLAVAFLGTALLAQYLYSALADQRSWIDELLVDPKATLQAMIDMESEE